MRRTARIGAAAVVAATSSSVGLLPGTPVPSATAQAALVQVSVRTEPARPQPGEDVVVRVRIRSCPPGDARAEVYLTTNDGSTSASTLMGQAPALTALWFRASASVRLPAAIEGWYGVRVVCGSFRPPRGPLANTTFAVGARPDKTMRLLATSVVEGGVLLAQGDGCPGSLVEYQVVQTGLKEGPFQPDGEISTSPDGSWSGSIQIPDSILPGSAEVKARCLDENRYGEIVTIPYGGLTEVTILRAPETSLPPAPPPASPSTSTGEG